MSKRREIDPEFRIWLIEECLAGRMRGREAARRFFHCNAKVDQLVQNGWACSICIFKCQEDL